MGSDRHCGYPGRLGLAGCPLLVIVTKNHIRTNGDGMILIDLDYMFHRVPTLKASVSNNDITLNDAYGGIQLYYGKGAVITNNRIAGTGDTGIYMGGNDFVDSCLLIGNNVNHVEASVAPILDGEGSSHCIVIGGNTKTNV
jgi:nitrous oxidase accessory protein NosD